MKKVLSVLTAGVFLAGALFAFTGCASEIKDEALVETIYEAIEATEITQFEAKCTIKTNYKSNSLEGTINRKDEQKITIAACELDGEIYADIFSDSHSQTKSKSAANQVTTTEDNYAISFVCGNETYSATGEWKNVHSKKGDFAALLEELYSKEKPLKGTYSLPSDFVVGTEDVQSFCEMAREVGAVAYKSGRGYFVKIDAKKAIEQEDAEFLEELLGVENKGGGKFDGDISIHLDDNYNVTAVDVAMDVSLTENTSTTSTMSMKVELDMEIKVPNEQPQLCVLTGFQADMGKRFIPGEYTIPEGEANLWVTAYGNIRGTYRGKVTVTDSKMIVDVTFEDYDKSFTVTEQREYNVLDRIDDSAMLFGGWELPTGQKVESSGGIRYYFRSYSSFYSFSIAHHEITTLRYDRYIKTL